MKDIAVSKCVSAGCRNRVERPADALGWEKHDAGWLCDEHTTAIAMEHSRRMNEKITAWLQERRVPALAGATRIGSCLSDTKEGQ